LVTTTRHHVHEVSAHQHRCPLVEWQAL
jgi:hypothetical protein